MLRALVPMLALGLLGAATQPPAGDGELAEGVALIRDGDFEAALPKLEAAVQRLEAAAPPRRELPIAHVYLGVCHLEQEQLPPARDHFRTAQCLDPSLRLDERSFSAQVLREFAAARDVHCRDVASVPNKGSRKPVLLVLGAGAAVAGVAVAAGGGGGGQANPTTTTVPIAVATTTLPTTSTTLEPGPTPTTSTTTPGPRPSTTTTTLSSGPTTTTTLPPTTTTTVPTTTTTTTVPPTTTTTLPACSYKLKPKNASFQSQGGLGTCDVTAKAGCAWTAAKDVGWITFTSGASGSGNGAIGYEVAGFLLGTRTGEISVGGSTDTCTVSQRGLLGVAGSASISWTSELSVPGATAQVVVNGAHATFQETGPTAQSVEGPAGWQRLEAQLVSSRGRPGTWRFELRGSIELGSLRVIAGEVLLLTDRAVVFKMAGQPGERVVLTFRTDGTANVP